MGNSMLEDLKMEATEANVEGELEKLGYVLFVTHKYEVKTFCEADHTATLISSHDSLESLIRYHRLDEYHQHIFAEEIQAELDADY